MRKQFNSSAYGYNIPDIIMLSFLSNKIRLNLRFTFMQSLNFIQKFISSFNIW